MLGQDRDDGVCALPQVLSSAILASRLNNDLNDAKQVPPCLIRCPARCSIVMKRRRHGDGDPRVPKQLPDDSCGKLAVRGEGRRKASHHSAQGPGSQGMWPA